MLLGFIQDIISLFNVLSTPYMLTDGSLLNLFRHCGTGFSDIDFTIQLNWWRNNSANLRREFRKRGFKQEETFGDLRKKWGYAESWKKFGIKVDLYGNIFENGLSVVPLWIGKHVFPCAMKVQNIVHYQWLDNVIVKGPYPIRDALESVYGRNYLLPLRSWSWDRDSFVTGYCTFERSPKKYQSHIS